MKICIHEREEEWPATTTMTEVAANFPGADILLVNGHHVKHDYKLQPGDECWCLSRGGTSSKQEMEDLLALRHTPEIQRIIQTSTVGIMGLGGLGSMVAVALARMGIGRLLLADFDVVEPTNLNRQYFFLDQVGSPKTKAMAANLARINPFVELELLQQRLDAAAIKKHFSKVDVLVECFDDPVMKADAFRLALTDMKPIRYVGASGVAGYGSNNDIRTQSPYPGIYLVGDGHSDPKQGLSLMAARVGIAAHQQANQVVRILLKDSENAL